MNARSFAGLLIKSTGCGRPLKADSKSAILAEENKVKNIKNKKI